MKGPASFHETREVWPGVARTLWSPLFTWTIKCLLQSQLQMETKYCLTLSHWYFLAPCSTNVTPPAR